MNTLLAAWVTSGGFMLVLSLIGLLITHVEIADYGRSKDRQRNLRWSWLALFGSFIAPIAIIGFLGYGLYRSVRPIRNSLVYAFGRKKEER